jgi:hypothetical protein
MKYKILFLFFLSLAAFAQQDKTTYITVEGKKKPVSPFFIQYEVNIPFRLNENRGEVYNDGSTNKYWFLPNGLSTAIGYGLQQKKWVGISAHTGIDWIASQKLVAVPLYINFRLSPRIYDESRLVFQAGFGRGFALGRGNLNAEFQKYSIGFETDEDLNIYLIASGYDFKNGFINTGYIGLGISVRRF